MKRTLDEKYHNVDIIEKIKDNNYLDVYESKIELCFYNNSNNKLYDNINSEFKEQIYSISVSAIQDKICICMLNKKNVKIFDYDIEEEILELNKEEIKDNSVTDINHFYKCIQISKNVFITGDDKYITIWSYNFNNFLEVKKIEINTITCDLLLSNDEYFISSQPQNETLRLFDKNNYELLKIISNIDCINSTNSLIKSNKYILINCNKGFGIFDIITKELIQYIEYNNLEYNRISCDEQNTIYVLNIKKKNQNNNEESVLKIMIGNIIEKEFTFIKDYEEITCNYEKLNLSCLENNILLLWNNDVVYSSKEI